MGLLALTALIPALRGEIGAALVMLGADYLLDSQDRKDRREEIQGYLFHPSPIREFHMSHQDCKNFIFWALRLRKFPTKDQFSLKVFITEKWNSLHSKLLYLNSRDDLGYNMRQMARVWEKCGRP